MLGVMMVLPLIIFMLIPDPYATISILGSNMVMLLYIRKFYKGITKGILGSKATLICSVCEGKRFDGKGICKRCGSRNRRLG